MNKPIGTAGKIALVLLPTAILSLLVIGLADSNYTQWLFIHTTYYFGSPTESVGDLTA